MKERPILFSGPMVVSILEDRKTQTRRLKGLEAVNRDPNNVSVHLGPHGFWYWKDGIQKTPVHLKSPHGKIGDRLWVRESFWYDTREPDECVIYSATPDLHKYRTRGIVERCETGHTTDYLRNHKFWKQKPSIFLKRWASRITLEITNVRAERLLDVSEKDVLAEGLVKLSKDGGKTFKFGKPDRDGLPGGVDTGWPWDQWKVDHVEAFAQAWDKINGPRSAAKNPWVWVYNFKRLETVCAASAATAS